MPPAPEPSPQNLAATKPSVPAPKRNVARGVVFKLISTIAFTMMSAVIKLLGASYPIGELVFCRSLFAIVPLIIWLAWQQDIASAVRTRNILGHVRRSFIGTAAMFSGFAALAFLPLSDATAIGYAAPLFTVVLAAIVLKETVRLYRWTAVAAGFAGVIVMLLPHLGQGALAAGLGDSSAKGAALGLTGAICAAFATIEVRRLTGSETTGAIVFYFSTMSTVFGALTVIPGSFVEGWAWHLPINMRDAALMILVGLLGGLGQILMTQSFRHADASVIATFDYMSMIWAGIIGYFLFGELPELLVVAGALIVMLAGVFVIWRERQLGIRREKQQSASPPRAL
jgi:drug/metabolite transporter (DMT)-like permease